MGKQVTASALMGRALESLEKTASHSDYGKGMDVTEEVLDAREKAREMAEEGFDVMAAMERAGFPSKFRRTDWVTPEFVKRYAPPDSRPEFRDFRGLFLTGLTGRKKSASLSLMARDWITRVGRKGSKAWGFVSFPELCVELQEAWGEGAGGP